MLMIGYGVGIPRSPSKGLHGLTIGFGSTLLGPAIAYWQGIRGALRRESHVRETHRAGSST
jgi:hypothetical protein